MATRLRRSDCLTSGIGRHVQDGRIDNETAYNDLRPSKNGVNAPQGKGTECQCRERNEPPQITANVRLLKFLHMKAGLHFRASTTSKNLQLSEISHKQTSAELQRTRTLLQGVRATHYAELKKKEKEIERVMEKWQKLSDTQAKLSSVPSGMRCLNATVVEGNEVVGKGQGYLEIALEQAEQTRSNLSDDNLFLRKLLVRSINELQSILHHARCLISGDQNIDEVRLDGPYFEPPID